MIIIIISVNSASLISTVMMQLNARLLNREDKAIWTDDMLKQHEQFAQWLLDNADIAYNPPMPIIDTSSIPPAEVAEKITSYIMQKWNERNTATANNHQ